MGTESAKQAIARELAQLRKLSGPLDAAKLTRARMLVKAFGGDDPVIALERLVNLAREHAEDREIDAAMSSFGWNVAAETSLGRLAEYSERHFVDPRTVRRWADAGIVKLAVLAVGTGPWIQPRGRQLLEIENGVVKLALDLHTPPNIWMGAPEMWVNDHPVDVGLGPMASMPEQSRSRTHFAEIAGLSDLPLELRFRWTGEKLPVYEAVSRASLDIVVSSRLVFRELRTTITHWRH